jgi:hypothetical protein
LNNAEEKLQVGFTTIGNLGTVGDDAVGALRRALESGQGSRPTIVRAVRQVAAFHGDGGRGSPLPFGAGRTWEHDGIDADGLDAVVGEWARTSGTVPRAYSAAWALIRTTSVARRATLQLAKAIERVSGWQRM